MNSIIPQIENLNKHKDQPKTFWHPSHYGAKSYFNHLDAQVEKVIVTKFNGKEFTITYQGKDRIVEREDVSLISDVDGNKFCLITVFSW